LENLVFSNQTTGSPNLVANPGMVKTNIKVLIVDDRAAVRESLRTILSLEDDFMVVGEAASGREAVKVAQSLQPDLVLMDLEMPDAFGELYDGVVACENMKLNRICRKVVILTVHADQASRQRALMAGCDLFLEKGLNSFELLQKLRQVGTAA
jgi:DNA-binding NarL/FixJ family response regulator